VRASALTGRRQRTTTRFKGSGYPVRVEHVIQRRGDKTFTDIIAKSQDWGTQFKETVEGALTSVNDAILHILTNKPQAGEHPFRAAGKQIFTGIAKTGLDDAEGSLMKFLTGDKGKLGTKGQPHDH